MRKSSRKKRYFCDLWRKISRPNNYTIEIIGLTVFFIVAVILLQKYEKTVAVFFGLDITIIVLVVICMLGDFVSKKSERNKNKDTEENQ